VTTLYQPEAQRIGRSKRVDEEGAWESLSGGTKRASRRGTPSGARRPEGHVGESSEVFADRDDMVAYAERNDPYPIHVDEQFAATSPFGGLVASFGYTVSLYLRIIHDMELFRATGSTFMGVLEWRSRFAARSARRPPTRPRDDIEQAAREQGQRGA
jgi:hypothetical protein